MRGAISAASFYWSSKSRCVPRKSTRQNFESKRPNYEFKKIFLEAEKVAGRLREENPMTLMDEMAAYEARNIAGFEITAK